MITRAAVPGTIMRATLFIGALAGASAFAPGAQPLKLAASPACSRATNAEMMPKFLKDLFPDMEKPDNPLGAVAKFFGLEDKEPEPEPEPAPEEPEPPAEE